MKSHLFGPARGAASLRLLLAVTLLTAMMLSGCTSEPGLYPVASRAIEGYTDYTRGFEVYASVNGVVLPEGLFVLAGSSLLSLEGKRFEEQVRLSSEYRVPPDDPLGAGLLPHELQPWDGAIVMVREASDGTGQDGDTDTYHELVLVDVTGDGIATEVLLAAPQIDQVLVVPGDDFATVMAVVSGDEETGRWLSTLRLTPDGPPKAVSEQIDVHPDLVTAESAEGVSIGALIMSAGTDDGQQDSELRVFGPEGSPRWSASVPGSGLVGTFHGMNDSGWLVDTTSMPGPEEWDPELTLLTETSAERFELGSINLRAITTGDFDAASPGDEILLSGGTIIEPGRHESSLIIGTLADGRVEELYTVAEWDQRLRGVTLADVNGNGRSDIVVVVDTESPRHYEQYLGRVEVFLNSGDGFGPPLVSPVYDSIRSLDLIDLDGDGMLEVLIAYVEHPEEAAWQGSHVEPQAYVDVLKIK